jgi:uncharacterized protein YlxW (UPF0749 family)
MTLLHELMTHSLDQGYLDAAAGRAQRLAVAVPAEAVDGARDTLREATPSRNRRPGRATVAAGLVLALAGVLFATSAVATHRGNAAAKHDRSQLVQQVQQQTAVADSLQRQVESLRTQVTNARNGALSATDRGGALQAQIQQLEQVDGGVAVDGQGVQVVLDDAPTSGNPASDGTGVILDTDLQRAVNGLFQAGAEAVAINGQRLTSQTAIREAGGAILVDYRPLSPPYTIGAIGPDAMGSAFLNGDTGQLLVTEHQLYGLRFTVTDHQRLTLPSAADLVVHYAKPMDQP